MIKLVPIDAVKASEYNPRRNDEKRLALAELSLRKLGFRLVGRVRHPEDDEGEAWEWDLPAPV